MDLQSWAWVIALAGAVPLIPSSIKMGRAQDPRDPDGRKVSVDAGRLAAAKRAQAWTVGIALACFVASCALRVLDDPEPFPALLLLLVPGIVIFGGLALVARYRARRDAADRE